MQEIHYKKLIKNGYCRVILDRTIDTVFWKHLKLKMMSAGLTIRCASITRFGLISRPFHRLSLWNWARLRMPLPLLCDTKPRLQTLCTSVRRGEESVLRRCGQNGYCQQHNVLKLSVWQLYRDLCTIQESWQYDDQTQKRAISPSKHEQRYASYKDLEYSVSWWPWTSHVVPRRHPFHISDR